MSELAGQIVIAALITVTAITVGVANAWRRRARDLYARLSAVLDVAALELAEPRDKHTEQLAWAIRAASVPQ